MATEFISNSWLMPTNANAEANRVSNYSLDFDGSSQYLNISDVSSISTNAQGSISFWLNFAGDSNTRYAFGISDTNANTFLTIGINSSENLDIIHREAGSNLWRLQTTGSAIVLNTWQHICLTQNGTACEVYVNGVKPTQSGAGTEWLSSLSGLDLLTIGALYKSSALVSPLEGKITEASIFDYALSASQVTQLYGTGSAIGNPMSLTTKPVAYYPLGDAAFNGEFLATNNATELYENYSLAFDGSSWISTGIGLTDLNISTQFTLSLWVKIQTNTLYDNIISAPTSTNVWDSGFGIYLTGSALIFWVEDWNDSNHFATSATLNNDQWYHVCCTFSTSNGLKLYIDAGTPTTASNTDIDGLTNDLFIGSSGNAATRALNGNISNVSFYNSELLSAQVTTLYNSGKPFNLNTFAVTPVSWWRLGASGSSFDGTNWTVLDEIGTNNGTSANMTQSDLVDGVGATGSGTSSGMSSGTNKTGDAPYSSNNAVSYNMSVTAESTSVPT